LLNETATAALETHAASYTRRFGKRRPEWFVSSFSFRMLPQLALYDDRGRRVKDEPFVIEAG
jgi:hypothetical protein